MSGDRRKKIDIRLTLKEGEEWYDYFLAIQKKLGIKKHTDVVRHLIKYYYDEVFGSNPQASGGKPSPE